MCEIVRAREEGHNGQTNQIPNYKWICPLEPEPSYPITLYPSELRGQHRGGSNGEVLPLSGGLAKCSSCRHANYMKEFCLWLEQSLCQDSDGVDPEQGTKEFREFELFPAYLSLRQYLPVASPILHSLENKMMLDFQTLLRWIRELVHLSYWSISFYLPPAPSKKRKRS